jgi:hypothetical protein
MPSMSRGGKRVGAGRRRGTSRQTIARNAIKAVANTLHLKPGKSRPALEVLQDLLDEALAIAAYFKPGPENKHADRAAHERFHVIARDTAKELAKYQAPQLRAITVTPPPPLEERRRFTLRVFTHEHQPVVPVVDVTPTRMPVTRGHGFDGDDAA